MLCEKDEENIQFWFTRNGHHRNASVIYITQNMFQQSKSSRTISLNSRYMILFRNVRNKNQVKTLAQQMQAPHLLVNMAIPYTSNSVLAALQNLSQQTNRVERKAVLNAGLKEILK